MTRRDDHARVLAGIEAGRGAGFTKTKLDAVIMRGQNDDELADLIEFGRTRDIEVRFIEYMDVPGATRWSPDQVVSRDQMLEEISRRFGSITPVAETSSASGGALRAARRHDFRHHRFDHRAVLQHLRPQPPYRRRHVVPLLYATQGTDLRGPLRAGISAEDLAAGISQAWQGRSDRGAEQRKMQHLRGAFVGLEELRRNPHLEMHTRGG